MRKIIKKNDDESHFEIVINEHNEEIKFAIQNDRNVPDKFLELE